MINKSDEWAGDVEHKLQNREQLAELTNLTDITDMDDAHGFVASFARINAAYIEKLGAFKTRYTTINARLASLKASDVPDTSKIASEYSTVYELCTKMGVYFSSLADLLRELNAMVNSHTIDLAQNLRDVHTAAIRSMGSDINAKYTEILAIAKMADEKLSELNAAKKRSPQQNDAAISNGAGDDSSDTALEEKILATNTYTPDAVTWNDVVGMEDVYNAFHINYMTPLLFPLMVRNSPAISGILLFGVPGTGKTMVVDVLINETLGIEGQNEQPLVLKLDGASIHSKYHGDSSKMVRAFFSLARKHPGNVILFIDEVDGILSNPDNVGHVGSTINQFIDEWSRILNTKKNGSLLVIGTTNFPGKIIQSARRRFQLRIEIPMPNADARKSIFKIKLNTQRHCVSDKEMDLLAAFTDGFTGDDIRNIINAANRALHIAATRQEARFLVRYCPNHEDPPRALIVTSEPSTRDAKRVFDYDQDDSAQSVEIDATERMFVLPVELKYANLMRIITEDVVTPSVDEEAISEIKKFTNEK